MKKLILSAAALMLASALSFAGTPESKGEAKPETKTNPEPKTFHYKSQSTAENAYQNISNWEEGSSPFANCGTGDNRPCEILADDLSEVSSMITGKSNEQVLLLTDSNRP